MKKRYVILIIGIVLAVGYAFWHFSSSHATYYNNISSYVEDYSELYFDFYTPESYFNKTEEKETLKERNDMKVYYQGNPEDNYHVSFDMEDMEVIYWVNKDKDTYDLSKYEKINEDNYSLYYSVDETLIVSVLDNCVAAIEVRNNNEYSLNDIKDILVDIMVDSLINNHML